MLAYQSQVTFFGAHEKKALSTEHGEVKRLLSHQPAEMLPLVRASVQVGEVVNVYVKYAAGGHALGKIAAWFALHKAFEGNHYLVLRKKEEVFLGPGFIVGVIGPENAFENKAEVFANAAPGIIKFALAVFPLLPARCRKREGSFIYS